MQKIIILQVKLDEQTHKALMDIKNNWHTKTWTTFLEEIVKKNGG